MNTIHDFAERLKYSAAASDEPCWEAIYRKAFPDFVSMANCDSDTQLQRLGVDRVVCLGSGRILKIDEKKREKEYQDILLEYISVDTTGALGWMDKPLLIDYLAYAFMPTKRVYLLGWDLLRRAWLNYKSEWIRQYPRIEAKNATYTTISVAVPIAKILDSVRTAAIIQL